MDTRAALSSMRRRASAARPADTSSAHDIEGLLATVTADKPRDVLFWTGAGISVPGPSSLPTGWELTERAFRSFFEPDALATVLGYHALAGWFTNDLCDAEALSSARLPRLETVLGVAERRFPQQVADILGDITHASPNWYHDFFAQHLAAGGHHITANFDTCIEAAYAATRDLPGTDPRVHVGQAPGRPLIEHFHRSLDTSTTAAELGSTLERIQGGFEDALRERIVGLVKAARTIVFVGYSGSDFFDVDVAFANLKPDDLQGKTVVWIAHSIRCECHEATPDTRVWPPLAIHLQSAGAHLRFLCGPTDQFLAVLARQWTLVIRPPYSEPRHVAHIAVDISSTERRAATFELYRELGLPAEVERMLLQAEHDPQRALAIKPSERWWARSEVLWEQGRWSQLRRMWRSVPPEETDELVRAERIGASLWVQGRLIPAYLWLSRRWRRAEQENGPEAAWPLAETLARVIEHMGRIPGLRIYARLSARRTAARLGEPDQRAGVHTFRRHQDLQTSLAALARGRERAPGNATTSQQWFIEAGSVLASISYSHRALRDLRSAGGLSEPGALDAAYRGHFHAASAIGSVAGAWRTALLPDADQVFTLADVLASVFALQYGPVQRARIVARHIMKKMLRQLRLSK